MRGGDRLHRRAEVGDIQAPTQAVGHRRAQELDHQTGALLDFLADVKAGKPRVEAPVYSHVTYDILAGERIVIDRPDILIVEGLNVLQPARLPKDGMAIPFVSDFFDFSIYIDAEPDVIERWYVARFLKLRSTAFRDPAAYFHRYAGLTNDEAVARALRNMNIPTRTEFKKAVRRIDALEAEVADLKAKGVMVTTVDKSAFEKATGAVDDKWLAQPIGPYVKKVIAAARAK